jgi:YHS domain-containing protein
MHDVSDIPIFFILDDIPHSSLEQFNIWLSQSYWGFNYYFCNIKLCCLWRFDDNMSVIYWEIICAKILFYIYCRRVRHLYTGQQWRIFPIRHLNSLIFDCLSLTEGLITCLSTVDSEAPASSNTFVTSLWPFIAAQCRGENVNFKKICHKILFLFLCDDDNWNVYRLLL